MKFLRLARFALLPALLVAMGLLASCEKLDEFLPKPPKKEAAPEPALTAEEEQLQKTLEGSNVFTPAVDDPVPVATAFELNRSSVVSLLLYHDFVPRLPRNEMMVSVPVFRAQMQALKDANIPVIPMSDMLAWKRGEKNIPDEAVVITLDDGWIGVYELAYPILKEFKYPFTLYLYKNYVGTGGRSMTVPQIREMLGNGAELGSHTLSHQALAKMRRSMSEEKYKEWLTAEIVESKRWLEATFNVPCPTLAYPYGDKNAEIVKFAIDSGYEAAVTVNPQKTTWDTPSGEIPRFTQLADQDANFKIATSFHGGGQNIANSHFIKTDDVNEQGKKLVVLRPEPNSTVADRRPLIEADLSGIGEILPETLTLRVSGFGAVPLSYNPTTKTVSYRIPQRLRREDCNVRLTFRRTGSEKDEVVGWQFNIDQSALYKPLPEFAEQAKPGPQP